MPAIPALDGAYNILVTGIGGTGVITIGALLGMAAHVDGKACSTLDFTGLSQKNGAVMSHVRIAPSADDLANVRIGPGSANLILGCDIVVATSIPALSRAERGVTRAVVNADLLPTASFVINPDIDFEAGTMREVAQRGRQRHRSRHPRRHRARHRADGRQHRHQFLHARLCVPARRDSAVAGGDHEGDRPQRRGDRDEQAGVLLGPARRARSAARRHARPASRIRARRRPSGRSTRASPSAPSS